MRTIVSVRSIATPQEESQKNIFGLAFAVMLSRIHVMGNYWHEHSDKPTRLGELVAAAKDHHSDDALAMLHTRLHQFASSLELTPTPSTRHHPTTPATPIVADVPNGPNANPQLMPMLTSAVAQACGTTPTRLLHKTNPAVSMRGTPTNQRSAVVEAQQYTITRPVEGQHLVLVDDVVLTETTLRHLARMLTQAGACTVEAVVAARTRLLV